MFERVQDTKPPCMQDLGDSHRAPGAQSPSRADELTDPSRTTRSATYQTPTSISTCLIGKGADLGRKGKGRRSWVATAFSHSLCAMRWQCACAWGKAGMRLWGFEHMLDALLGGLQLRSTLGKGMYLPGDRVCTRKGHFRVQDRGNRGLVLTNVGNYSYSRIGDGLLRGAM